MNRYWIKKKYQALLLLKQILLSIFLVAVCSIPLFLFIRPEGEGIRWNIIRIVVCLAVIVACYKIIPLVRKKLKEY